MTIDNVEFSADLMTIIEELVAELRANDIPYIQKVIDTSNNVQVCCPFHKDGLERRPSAGIRKSDGTFHCLACGEVHSLPEVISYCFGRDISDIFGWTWLLKNFASVEIENRKEIDLDFSRTAKTIQKQSYVTEEELDKYRYYHDYWTKRKITSDWILNLFDLGYDKTTDCITFPNRDLNGNCLFVARRHTKTKYFNYPSGATKPIYGLYEIMQLMKQGIFIDEIIICESMIDALTCFEYGKYACALNGLGTDEQFTILRNFPCRKYILATDMDDAGLRARVRLKKALSSKIVTEFKWDRSVAKDINDMSKEYFDSLIEYF